MSIRMKSIRVVSDMQQFIIQQRLQVQKAKQVQLLIKSLSILISADRMGAWCQSIDYQRIAAINKDTEITISKQVNKKMDDMEKRIDRKIDKVRKKFIKDQNNNQRPTAPPPTTQTIVLLPPQPPPPPQQPSITTPLQEFIMAFNLDPQGFDLQAQYKYQGDLLQPTTSRIGGFPYYRPVMGLKYHVNILGHYDNGSDQWLNTKNQKGQWAVAFYGIHHPTRKCSNGKIVLKSIMDGRLSGQMLLPGTGQYYSNQTCIKSQRKVQNGVYVYPHFEQALLRIDKATVIGSNEYYFVLQCRVRPDRIKIPTSKQDFWVMNKPQYIRPHAVVLFTEQQKQSIQNHMGQYHRIHKKFVWSEHSRQYQRFGKL